MVCEPLFGVGYSLVGIGSRGFGCGERLGVYTQVGNYAQWLKRAKSALENCASNNLCFNQDKVNSGGIIVLTRTLGALLYFSSLFYGELNVEKILS